MLNKFLILLFSSFLLLQTTGFAEETSDIADEPNIEELRESEPLDVPPEPQKIQEPENAPAPEVDEAKEEMSEAQREADAAEAAELQEVGVGEEPVVD